MDRPQIIDHIGDDDFHVTDARWSVLSDDHNQPGAVSLRVYSHRIEGETTDLRLLFTVEQLLTLMAQLRVEVLPYYASLIEGVLDEG